MGDLKSERFRQDINKPCASDPDKYMVEAGDVANLE